MSATHAVVDSPVGELTLVASSGALSGLYFAHHWYRPDPARFGRRTGGGFEEATAQLAEYFARDVGAAVGRNPLSVLVPCHRVVGKDGKLTGYAGGLRRKRFLLDLERSHVSATGSVYLT